VWYSVLRVLSLGSPGTSLGTAPVVAGPPSTHTAQSVLPHHSVRRAPSLKRVANPKSKTWQPALAHTRAVHTDASAHLDAERARLEQYVVELHVTVHHLTNKTPPYSTAQYPYSTRTYLACVAVVEPAADLHEDRPGLQTNTQPSAGCGRPTPHLLQSKYLIISTYPCTLGEQQ
jgi:hypothetical protein